MSRTMLRCASTSASRKSLPDEPPTGRLHRQRPRARRRLGPREPLASSDLTARGSRQAPGRQPQRHAHAGPGARSHADAGFGATSLAVGVERGRAVAGARISKGHATGRARAARQWSLPELRVSDASDVGDLETRHGPAVPGWYAAYEMCGERVVQRTARPCPGGLRGVLERGRVARAGSTLPHRFRRWSFVQVEGTKDPVAMSPKDPVLDSRRARFERSPVDSSHAAGLGSTVEVKDLATGAELACRLVEVHDAVPNRTARCRSHLPSARRFARIVSARW
jgi:hypothetical protein